MLTCWSSDILIHHRFPGGCSSDCPEHLKRRRYSANCKQRTVLGKGAENCAGTRLAVGAASGVGVSRGIVVGHRDLALLEARRW